MLDVTPGSPTADSYGSLAGAAAYHAARGNAAWTGDDEDLEAALRRATLAIDWLYQERFPGTRTNGRSQALQWPRTGVVDREGYSVPSDAIPVEIERATYEAALVELLSAGSFSTPESTSGSVISETIGDISITYASPQTGSAPSYPAIDGILSSLLVITSNTRRIIRG